jgi:hypothetical protein
LLRCMSQQLAQTRSAGISTIQPLLGDKRTLGRATAADEMDQAYNDHHNFNIVCIDRPVQDIEDMLRPRNGLGPLPKPPPRQ